MARALRSVDPNTFTWFSLLAAGIGGYAFYASGPTADAIGWLWLGWAMVITNSVLDLLDGKVAKMTDRQTQKGDFLDHAVDRFSDVLFLGGLALSGWVSVEIGLLALVFTLLTSYLGTQAQAIGMGRNYGGLLGRADRMVLLIIVPVAQVVVWQSFDWNEVAVGPVSMSLLGWMMAYIAAVGAVTTVQRFVWALRGFEADGSVKR